MEYRTLWGDVSVDLILRLYQERVEIKKRQWAQGIVGHLPNWENIGPACDPTIPRDGCVRGPHASALM